MRNVEDLRGSGGWGSRGVPRGPGRRPGVSQGVHGGLPGALGVLGVPGRGGLGRSLEAFLGGPGGAFKRWFGGGGPGGRPGGSWVDLGKVFGGSRVGPREILERSRGVLAGSLLNL